MPRELDVARRLIEVGRRFDARGWVLGTSGNFSAVVSEVPLRLAITTSGTAKGELTTDQILEIDGDARPCDAGAGRPSANAQLHLSKSRLSRRAAFGSIGQPGMIGRDFRPLGVDRGMFRWSASTATTR